MVTVETAPAKPAALQASSRTWLRWGFAVGVLTLIGLGLRLWGIKQGLPYSYNSDEAQHFVPRAVAFFTHDFNPHYFLNPPAYSYLLHIVFELWFSAHLKDLGYTVRWPGAR